jgi:hypothetical protein
MNKPRKEHILKTYGREPETLDELARCVIYMINSQENGDVFDRRKRSQPKMYKVAGFAWDVHYSDMVSNSHSSPEGYPQNWSRKEDAVKGYPGWQGRVWIRYTEECRSFGSSPFEKTLTHTGTGGAGGYNGPWQAVAHHRWERYGNMRRVPKDVYPEIKHYSWDYRFYDLDWPLLAHWVEKQKMWAELSGQPWDNSHRFEWTDPEILAADAKFIAECATTKAKETA